jgi:hypothetical protein
MQVIPKSAVGWWRFVVVPFEAYVAFACLASGLRHYDPELFPGSLLLFPLSLFVLLVGGIAQLFCRGRTESVVTFGFALLSLSLCLRLAKSLAS